MIPEEDDPASRSVTDTSHPPQSRHVGSEHGFIEDIEKADEDAKRKTQVIKSPARGQVVSFHEDVISGQATEERFGGSIETRARPRADEVMKDLQLDLSEDGGMEGTSQSPTDNMTEKQSKMETGAIIEEESSNLVSSAERPDNSSKTSAVIPVPEGHEEPALYNDFLGR